MFSKTIVHFVSHWKRKIRRQTDGARVGECQKDVARERQIKKKEWKMDRYGKEEERMR